VVKTARRRLSCTSVLQVDVAAANNRLALLCEARVTSSTIVGEDRNLVFHPMKIHNDVIYSILDTTSALFLIVFGTYRKRRSSSERANLKSTALIGFTCVRKTQ
jgi:hypothetical protein